MKQKCYRCKTKIATWEYMPAIGRGDDAEHYYCDDCVSRGCSCQLDFETNEPLLDDKGKELPCCEYDYCEFGYDSVDEQYECFDTWNERLSKAERKEWFGE